MREKSARWWRGYETSAPHPSTATVGAPASMDISMDVTMDTTVEAPPPVEEPQFDQFAADISGADATETAADALWDGID